ncbi:MAG: hypothetical protein GY833_09705 [Aestuariibacter sp.]|nr:hypothetical protein [Aestuariibacter sp.]
MIEYYGWVNIRDNAYESDSSDLYQIVEDIKSLTEEIEFDGRILQLKWMNGNCILCAAGSTNHRTKSVTDVIKLVEIIAQRAPGSYGVLYVYDDEDKEGTNDEFQVFRIAKGKCSVEQDKLFSPCSVKIFESSPL